MAAVTLACIECEWLGRDHPGTCPECGCAYFEERIYEDDEDE